MTGFKCCYRKNDNDCGTYSDRKINDVNCNKQATQKMSILGIFFYYCNKHFKQVRDRNKIKNRHWIFKYGGEL